METSPKVSVLMPAHNTDKYIGEAIESILKQTFKDFELIIIDDGSTDQTWKIIQEYARKDSRVIPLQNEKNLGISPTRNRLIALSKGKYIVWQDADDISMPYRIEHQYIFMEDHPDVGICGGYLQFFNEKGLTSVRKYAPDDASLRKSIFRYSPVAQPSAIVRKSCFESLGSFSESLAVAEDLACSFKIGTRYKFANLEEILIKYRESPMSATYKHLAAIERNTLMLRRHYALNPSYIMSTSDVVLNCIQTLSIFLIPSRLKIWIFNLIRNS